MFHSPMSHQKSVLKEKFSKIIIVKTLTVTEDPMRDVDAKFKYVDDSNGFLAELYIDFDSSYSR